MRLLPPSRGDHVAEIERASKRSFSLGWPFVGICVSVTGPVIVDLHAHAVSRDLSPLVPSIQRQFLLAGKARLIQVMTDPVLPMNSARPHTSTRHSN